LTGRLCGIADRGLAGHCGVPITGRSPHTSDGRPEILGIASHVAPDGEEFARAMAIARDIEAAAPTAVRLTKRAINRAYEAMGMHAALVSALAWRDARFAG
jgi:hypothetical protein